MKYIKLTRNRRTIVDDEKYDELSKHKWYCSTDGYAVRNIYGNGYKQAKIRMNRVIMGGADKNMVDHVNGDRLDNRLNNLRIVTNRQNQYNSKYKRDNSSGYKGVSWNKRIKKWQVYISINRKNTYIGIFDEILNAINAYNYYAKKHFKEFACLNKI